MRTLVLASALATLLSAPVLAQDDPALENCVKYAEADSTYEVATRDAKTEFGNAIDEAYAEISAREKEAVDRVRSIKDQASEEYHKGFQAASRKYNLAVEKLAIEHRRAIGKLKPVEQVRSEKKETINANFRAMRDKLRAERDAVLGKLTEKRDNIHNDPRYSFQAMEAMMEKFRAEQWQTRSNIEAMYQASVKEPKAIWEKAYEQAYEGPTSDNPEIMKKLRDRHRARCKALYDM